MKRCKYINNIILTLFCICCLQNFSLAQSESSPNGRYPDYAYEFVGRDPWEGFNRKIFAFNLKANKYLIRPINIVWASVMPQYGIQRIDSFYTNMLFPVRLVGSLLQKDFQTSKSETKRFFINSTIGVAGLYDVATLKFGIEAHQEDVEQALAFHNFKKGPYLVLPIVAQGNIRDLAGKALDLPLNPMAYIVGPISAISTGVSLVNGTTMMQPVFKMADNYSDPYIVAKQLYGIERYIKNTNLDRKEVFKEKSKEQELIEINNISSEYDESVVADIDFKNYNPQSSEIDSLRTMLFDSQKLGKSKWADLSVWNKNFNKQIKTDSVKLYSGRDKYHYRYILQDDKMAPIAILYPSIGEGIMSNQSVVFSKILFDEGYSVVILGSPFQWEFVKSMPKGYAPGLPFNDAKQLRFLTSKVLENIELEFAYKPDKKVLVGTSFGALTGIFVANQEEGYSKENPLGLNFSDYIFINPPVEIFYALKKLDGYAKDLSDSPSDVKLRTAITAQKIIQVMNTDYKKDNTDSIVSLPFTEEEAKLAISYAMRLKLSDLVYTIEKEKQSKRKEIYSSINQMSFYDYSQKYLIPLSDKGIDELSYDSSLYSVENFLKNSEKYKIYHSTNDCFVCSKQLAWLKKAAGDKSVYFNNGSHLGELYRKEFLEIFKNEIKNLKTDNVKKL